MDRLARTKAILGDLIAFPTVSADPNLEMIAYLADLLGQAGAHVELQRDDTGHKANLFATLGPEVSGGVVLSGHSDVVPVAEQPWTLDPFAMTERDGRLYGRGACDMKGFIAAALAMAPEFASADRARPIHFAFTYDEEVGCLGARALMRLLEDKPYRPAIAIIGEPTEMRIIEGHKGCYEYTTRFEGLAGHGSAPERGVNAVEFAVRYVARLLELKDELRRSAPEGSRFDPPWTTVNVGALQGGSAHNVIAGRAHVDWEMRPAAEADADYVKTQLALYCSQRLLPEMRAVWPEASIETEVIGEVAGLVPTDANLARRIVAELTGANGADCVPFGTEAGLFQALGMDVVVCGPGSIEQAHKADEYLEVAQLSRCLDMLSGLAERRLGPEDAKG
ncbi:acetylornithine deacetylase [Roseibacterium sp. SDUM158017]|uniref:acetylornithine deacetylase n=1 Tax=Roseicyclus salinarum TaxID=3036773 RepID=UPI0024152A85|nr:acetylornithine deacetylase [Roseibacterium sp. SDUM158017]MDG4647363.1 acetylornithine deacetylase [Roseibacterium sp. SDUM158017]